MYIIISGVLRYSCANEKELEQTIETLRKCNGLKRADIYKQIRTVELGVGKKPTLTTL